MKAKLVLAATPVSFHLPALAEIHDSTGAHAILLSGEIAEVETGRRLTLAP